MAFCSNCGAKLNDGGKFCSECGEKVLTEEKTINNETNKNYQRKTVFDGEAHKCPYCGEILEDAFLSNCSYCGRTLRNTTNTTSLNLFFNKINEIDSDEKKIEIIKTFPIPNDRENILEFMFLACSNFDIDYYVNHLSEKDISDAWLAKIEQCYSKGKYVLMDEKDLVKLEELYTEVNNKVSQILEKRNKDKKKSIIIIIIGSLLLFSGMGTLFGIILLSYGVVLYTNNGKQDNNNVGFKSWSPLGQFFWIILNIFTLGIPAIIYVCSKKKKI